MRKKQLMRVTALVAILAVLALSVPGVSTASVKNDKFSFKTLFRAPVSLFSSLFSFIPVFSTDTYSSQEENPITSKDLKKIKVTGGLTSVRPSGGD